MAGELSGNHLDAKLIHRLDDANGVDIGLATWTPQGGTTFQPALARFGNAMLANAVGEGLHSDAGLSELDVSDGAKMLLHCFGEMDDLSGNRSLFTLTESAFNTEKSAMFFEIFGAGRITFRWNRDTDLAAGEPLINVFSNAGLIVVDTPFDLVAYIDTGSTSQGKIFINGVDETSSVSGLAIASPAAATYNFVQLGNFVNGLNPGRILDHFTIIQSAGLSDAKVTLLAAQYNDTRGFGYRPTFLSLSAIEASPGDTVTLTGTGLGRDVAIRVNGQDATSIVRASESSVSFVVPTGIVRGLVNLEIENVESGVTFTEFNALKNIQDTAWTEGGGSTRIAAFGDGIISGMIAVGDPVPVNDPNVNITDWTAVSVDP